MAQASLQVIGDRYQIEQLIGTGGMGTVYAGRDLHTGGRVAVKHLKPEVVAANPAILERFSREAEALRQLNHPNIVTVYAAIEAGDSHFLVTEYVGGGDLSQLLKREGRFSVRRTLEIGLDLADALTRTHRLKIIHRDLKPANVLLADDGTPRLTDFGVAHMGNMERVTGTDVTIGTLDYLPPEAFDGSEIDARADIWSFGVLMFEMLAGERPFKGANISQVLANILSQPIPDLEALRSGLPVGLVDLIYRMLARDRNARITTVRQVGLELEALLQGHRTVTTTVERVAVDYEEARFATPTPPSNNYRHNLPAQTTPFVGREQELEALAGLLNDSANRLVSIVAPGGMGKTRLSLQAAEHQLPNFTHGVFLVELAPLAAPDQIVTAIAKAVGYSFKQDERPPRQQLVDTLRDKHMLLVLDNFEHLIDGAGLVTEILRAAPQVKALVTSRQRLGQTLETLFVIEGMDFPEWETPQDALDYSAVKLFMQSARRVRPDFELTADDLPYVARISRLVQGMPLAIVLAASWVEMLSPREIADEMGRSMDFLATEMSDLPERQRSIRAVFEYSWNLLNEVERESLVKLAVFRGGFTREAAQAVTGANLRVLMALVNKSLLRRDPESGRYAIHELLRQYMEEQLHGAGQVDTVREAHSGYYLDWGGELGVDLKGRDQLNAIRQMDADFENLRLAWQWAVKTRAETRLERALEPVSYYCEFQSRMQDSHDMFTALRETFTSGRLWALSVAYASMTLPNRKAAVEAALAGLQPENHHRAVALLLSSLGWIGLERREFDTILDFARQSLVAAETSGDGFYIGNAVQVMGYFLGITGNNEQSLNYMRRAIEVRKAQGDKIGLIASMTFLGTYMVLNHQRDGLKHLEETYETAKAINPGMSAWIATNFVTILVINHQLERARAVYAEAVHNGRNVADPELVSGLEMALMMIALGEGKYQEAVRLGESALSRPIWNPDEANNDTTGLVFAYLGVGDFDKAEHYLINSLRYAVESGGQILVDVLLILAGALLLERKPSEDVIAWFAAGWVRAATMWETFMLSHPALRDVQPRLRAMFGDAVFEATWARGAAMDVKVAAAEALAAMG